MKKLLAVLLLAGGAMLAADLSIGIRIGPPPPPRVIRVRPAMPGPEYLWVDGYWYPVSGRWVWHDGYWSRPYFPGARWVPPRHDGERFYEGYWDGERGKYAHDHRWDRERERDYNRERR